MLSRLVVLFAALPIAGFIGMTATAHAASDDPGNGNSWDITVQDIIKTGGSSGSAGSDGSQDGSWVSGTAVPDPCLYQRVEPRPADDDPLWRNHDPAGGDLWVMLCPDVLSQSQRDADGQNTVVQMNQSTPYYVSNGVDPDEGAAVVDPSFLIQRARATVTLPYPEPSFGPNPGELAVKFPVWFSVDAYEPQVRTATAGRYTAVVTAILTQTIWYPGELADPYRSSVTEVPPVSCDGAGVAYQDGMDPGHPPCGYTYIWRSLKERTHGVGAWTMTVLSHYDVTYRVTNTQTGEVIREGAEAVEPYTQALLTLREWRGVLGNADYAAPEIAQLPPVILPHN